MTEVNSHRPKDQTVVRLMGTTPMRDWARGRLTGRLDYIRMIDDAALPGPVPAAILNIVRRTRLWRQEKADIARELIAHFRDGLASGADPARLVEDFGEPAKVARLMRRAKKRSRPLAWRSMIYTRNAFAALCLLVVITYGLLAARFFSGRPNVKHDYLADINAPAASTPEADRAWPFYNEAFARIPRPLPEELTQVVGMYGWMPPDDPRRPAFRAYIQASQPALELLAQGSARRHMGHIISDEEDPILKEDTASGRLHRPSGEAADGQPMLLEVLLPSLGWIRSSARLTADDLQLALEERDSARAMRDLRILCSLSTHAMESPFLIGQLVGLAVMGLTCEQASHAVFRHGDLFTDDHLRELAHRLSSFGSGGTVRIRLDGEVAMFDDTLQHLYTDNGRGDGRIAGDGGQRVTSMLATASPLGPDQSRLARVAGPVTTAMTAGRAEIRQLYQSMLAEVMTNAELPMWDRAELKITEKMEAWSNSWVMMAKYWPIVALMPSFDRIQPAADVATQRRDALLTALAIELFHRRHGRWPASLDEIVPGLLPAMPRDQFDGRPIKYLIQDGGPVLYSVGVDRKDDQGRGPKHDSGLVSNWVSAARVQVILAQEPLRRDQIDGDWVLYPPKPGVVDPPKPPAEEAAPSEPPASEPESPREP